MMVQPAGELLCRPQVMVRSLNADAATLLVILDSVLAMLGQPILAPNSFDVGRLSELAAVEQEFTAPRHWKMEACESTLASLEKALGWPMSEAEVAAVLAGSSDQSEVS